MARVELPIVVLNSSTGLPVNGASVAIKLRSSGANATWWTQETGGTSSTAAVTTDASGRATAWLDRGAYNCTISGSGITTYTEPFDAAPAADSAIDAAWLSSLIVPSGLVLPYAGAASPDTSLWLMCDGSAVSRTTYAKLFSAVGITYGAGDGSSTFNVPDMRGRVAAGKGTHVDVDTLGESDGLAVGSRRPKHKHTVNDPGHAHPIHYQFGSTGTPNMPNLPLYDTAGRQFDTNVNSGTGSTGVTIGPQTGSEPTDSQAYLVLNHLIKT